jgi:CMP-N,N'-diacetyllegionaminic acid synthase
MLTIIPARGSSKGLPQKNILPIGDRPMIARAVTTVRAAKRVSRVIVSTEDLEIARIAKDAGAEVPFLRPEELAADDVPNGRVCLHVIDWLCENEGLVVDAFCLVQATSPFLAPESLDRGIALFEEEKASCVVSVRPMTTPIEAVFEVDSTGRLLSVLRHRYGAEPRVARRQAYGDRYVISGSFMILDVRKARIDVDYVYRDTQARAVIVDERQGIDIDTAFDYEFARFVASCIIAE